METVIWTATLLARFWAKVDDAIEDPDVCWLWKGARTSRGYGALVVNGKSVSAHRLAWEMANGPIPAGSQVLHRCNMPPCVRVTHLFLGDHATSMAEMARKGRAHSGTQKLTAEQVVIIRKLYELVLPKTAGRPKPGTITKATLADFFGVSYQTIVDAITGRTWQRI